MGAKVKLVSCIAGVIVAIGMLVMGVLAASRSEFLFQGNISFAVADKTLYVRNVRFQHGMDTPQNVPGFRQGFINNGFDLNMSKVDFGDNTTGTFTLYFDIINFVVGGQTHEYIASVDWAGDPVSGVMLSIEDGSETISEGTVSPTSLTDSTPISGTVALVISTTVEQTFDLSNISMVFSQKGNETEIETTPDASGNGVVISDYTGSGSNVVIPDTVGGKPVTTIGSSAFANNTDVTTVTIPETVTKIETDAFNNCSNLTTINLPEGITEIGDRAFQTCTKLTDIVLPEGLTKIGTSAFFNCSSISGVLNIPASVTEIGQAALTLLGLREFTVSEGNQHFAVEDGVLYNIDFTRLLTYPRSKAVVTNYAIRESVLTIDNSAFRICYNIRGTLILPPNLQKIGVGTFYGCSNITNETLLIPASVTIIGDSAFLGLRVSVFEVESGNTAYMSEAGVLYNADMTQLHSYPHEKTDSSFVIPQSVTAIAGSAFSGNPYLTSVVFPSDLTNIGNYAFLGAGLTGDIVLPVSVTSIGESAFGQTKVTSFSLNNSAYKTVDGALYNAAMTTLFAYPTGSMQESFVVPNGVTKLIGYTFREALNLKSITIPISVSEIGGATFLDCTNLQTVTIDSATIAAMLSSRTSVGYLIYYAETVYIKSDIVSSLADWFTQNYTQGATADGYTAYTKN